MQQGRSDYLFRGVECPDLDRSLGPFPPPFVDQGQQRKQTQRSLYEEGKRTQQFAFSIFSSRPYILMGGGVGGGTRNAASRRGVQEDR